MILQIPSHVLRRRAALGACLALLLASPARAADPAPELLPPAAEPAATKTGTAAEEQAPRVQADAVRQTYLRLMEEKRYPEAVEIAAQLVDLTASQHGERSPAHTAALTDLANAQMLLGNVVEAEGNYRAAIALIERAEGPGSPRLVDPLVGLGDNYMRGGFHAQANDAYDRALLVNHAADGFYNLEQIRILDGLSESYLGLNKLDQANARQRIQVVIQERRSDGGEPDVAAALYKLARWYNRTGQYAESRDAWQRARRVIRESGGPNDPAQVDALVGEALTYANEGAAPVSLSTFKRALDLLDAQPEPDRAKRAEVLVKLGDLYVVFRRPGNARQQYSQAWQELSADETLVEKRDEYFAEPSRIAGPRLPDIVSEKGQEQAPGRAGNAGLAEGFVVARFDVDADGVAREPVVIESQPPGLLDAQVLEALKGTAFRPRLADGTAVLSEGVQFRHDFRYPPAAAEPGEPASDTAPAGEKGGPIAYPGGDDDESGS